MVRFGYIRLEVVNVHMILKAMQQKRLLSMRNWSMFLGKSSDCRIKLENTSATREDEEKPAKEIENNWPVK